MSKKVGLVITTYNRPVYLQKTIDALSRSHFPSGFEIYFIDDCSSRETKKIIEEYEIPGIKIHKIYNEKNQGMYYGLKKGFEYFYESGFEVITNLDPDAVVKPYWVTILNLLLDEFPKHIISGFDTHRHVTLEVFERYRTKKSIGGINLFFSRDLYHIVTQHLTSNRWDWDLSEACEEENRYFIVAKPSLIDHIGVESCLKHFGADMAEDFQKNEY